MKFTIFLLLQAFLLYPAFIRTNVVWCSQTIDDRPLTKANDPPSKKQPSDVIKVVSGTNVKRLERMTVPLSGQFTQYPMYFGYNYAVPRWQAFASIVGEGESAINGIVTFQQLPYNGDIRVTINITGLPTGKHAIHIHTYGDLRDGCKSTGGQFPNNFIGNVDTKEDGSISSAFRSSYLNLFGFNGIVGRSIVIHEKPIDVNIALNAEVFSSSLQSMSDALAYQNEENSVGPAIACGIISITSTTPATVSA
ncbi:superoxide dismutase [Cu-Zn] [Bactrocera neohumeralis]|uniref:superoxide dismutase [Cu-Zn] n=1 Tax=Bactrocera neohumeralis TaxID=98809 RepID=UPI0021652A44|nr:superoxide dismutase [Cu-Zn] [Bactrocera neohumeralis]